MKETVRIQLKEHIEKEIASGFAPGCQLGVYQDGKEVFFQSAGMADMEKEQPVSRDTIFRIYSMTKPITSVLAHILIGRGLLCKEDLLEKYLPEYAEMTVYTEHGNVPAKNKIYIRDLLNMTSGLVYPGELAQERPMQEIFDEIDGALARGRDGYTTQQVVSMIAKASLWAEPGTAWHYGLSADVLGHVMELVTGMSLGQLMKKEIFDPLDMRDTGFYVPEEKQHRFAQLYDKVPAGIEQNVKPEGFAVANWRHLGLSYCLKQPAFESGGAGLVSTVEDYSHFARMLAAGGIFNGNRILSEETVRMFMDSHLSDALQPSFDWEHLQGYSYANYFRVGSDTPDRHIRAGEIGWDGWCGPYFFANQKKKLACVYMVQVGVYQHREFIHKLRELLYEVD